MFREIGRAPYECMCLYCSFTIHPIFKENETGRKIAVCPRCGLDWDFDPIRDAEARARMKKEEKE